VTTVYLAKVAGVRIAVRSYEVDDGPAADGRWLLHTSDAHGLYRQFGFAAPDDRFMERPGRPPR
jgi:hypothetical protein